MAFPTPTEFKTQYPEFANIADARIQFWLDYAKANVNEKRVGKTRYPYAVNAYAAHFLQLEIDSADSTGLGQGTGGDTSNSLVSSVTVGDVTTQFDTSASQSQQISESLKGDIIGIGLSQTRYGLMYLDIQRRTGLFVATTGMA